MPETQFSNEQFTLIRKPLDPGTGQPLEECRYALFPGMALAQSEPELVVLMYDSILHQYPDTAMFLSRGRDGADPLLNRKYSERLLTRWRKLGKPTMIIVTPEDMKFFRGITTEIPTVSLYDLLLKHNISGGCSRELYRISEPTPYGFEPAIRQLAENMGAVLYEPGQKDASSDSAGGTSASSTGGTGASSTGGTGASSTGGTGASSTGGTGASSTGGTGASSTGGTGASSTGGTGASSTGGTGASSTGGTGGPSSSVASTQPHIAPADVAKIPFLTSSIDVRNAMKKQGFEAVHILELVYGMGRSNQHLTHTHSEGHDHTEGHDHNAPPQVRDTSMSADEEAALADLFSPSARNRNLQELHDVLQTMFWGE